MKAGLHKAAGWPALLKFRGLSQNNGPQAGPAKTQGADMNGHYRAQLSDTIVVEIAFQGGAVTPRALRMLRAHIRLAEMALDETTKSGNQPEGLSPPDCTSVPEQGSG